MMGGMGHAAGQHPGTRPPHIEKRLLPFPPSPVLALKHDETLPAVLRVAPHEFQPDFFFRQRRRSDVYIEHRSKPNVLADALMYHMLVETAAARVGPVGTQREIIVP